MLIDARNRLATCKLAGVDPIWEERNIDDIGRYILSENNTRRHMTKGQRALAHARIFPDPEKGGRGKKSSLNEEFNGAYLSQARTVLKYAIATAEHWTFVFYRYPAKG